MSENLAPEVAAKLDEVDSTLNGAKAKVPKPKFAFNVSRKWGKRWEQLRIESADLIAFQLGLEEPVRDDTIENQQDRDKAYQTMMSKLMTEASRSKKRLVEIAEEQEQMIALVLVDVPREWLTDDAPSDEIDWHDPESLDWLTENSYSNLVQALDAARQANLGN